MMTLVFLFLSTVAMANPALDNGSSTASVLTLNSTPPPRKVQKTQTYRRPQFKITKKGNTK